MPQMVRSRSPVASGIGIAALSRLKTSMLPGTAGSSIHRTSYGLIAPAHWMSIGGRAGAVAADHPVPVGAAFLAGVLDHLDEFLDVLGVARQGVGPAGAALVGL